jgi:hypothetical protein
VILSGLGPQTDDDVSFISSNHAIQYVRDLENGNKHSEVSDFKLKCKDIRQKLPEKYKELVEIL